MAQLDQPRLDAIAVGINTSFDRQLDRVPTLFQDVSTVITTTKERVNFPFLGQVPKMVEWDGNRPIHKLTGGKHEIGHKRWANGIEAQDTDLEDDNLGMFTGRINDLADEGQWAIEDQVVSAYNEGIQSTARGTTYDGQALIDTDHTASWDGSGDSQSNLVTGALSPTTYAEAWGRMMAFTDERREAVRLQPDTLLVGIANRVAAREILERERLANGADNIERGSARLIVHPRITGTRWFLISSRQRIRPVIVVIRRGVRFASLANLEASYLAFMQGTYLFGADARFGVGYGNWWAVVGGPGL